MSSSDHLFDPTTSTRDVYEQVCEPIVWSSMEGVNGTIFAYGQTASGKTYTMKGQGKRNPGLIPLAVQDVFNYIRQSTDREFLLRVRVSALHAMGVETSSFDAMRTQSVLLNVSCFWYLFRHSA